MTQKKTSNLELHMRWWFIEDDNIIRMDYCGISPSMTHSDDVYEENGNKMQETGKPILTSWFEKRACRSTLALLNKISFSSTSKMLAKQIKTLLSSLSYTSCTHPLPKS